MLRAFFLALGIYAFILGLECLVLDKAVLSTGRDALAASTSGKLMAGHREITPTEGASWGLLSAGAVVMLYSFTLPAKMRG